MDDFEFVMGFVLGWSFAAGWVFAVAWFYMPNIFEEKVMKWMKGRKKKMKKMKKAKQKVVQERNPKQTTSESNQDIKIHIMDKYATRMSLLYLLRATDNFRKDNIIASGKVCTLYKAAIGNGNILAVKLFRDSHDIELKLMYEIMTYGRLPHRNLVPLLGFSMERKVRLLVYNYMANGSLYDLLHPVNAKGPKLNWAMRFMITIGIARGLAWLHHNCDYRVTHGNICSKFILLDKNFDPKISNFGQGMVEELNPPNSKMRIYEKGEFKESDDVYAFGILILEVVTGEKPEDLLNLCEGLGGNLSSENFYDAVDGSLVGKGFDREISQFLKVATECIRPHSNERPTMLEVYRTLSSGGAKNGGNYYDFGILEQMEDGFGNHVAQHSEIEIVEEIE